MDEISLADPLPSPHGGDVWAIPPQVGRWRTVVDDCGQPIVHSGGGGYGWLAEDDWFPGQLGFVKRNWWTDTDARDPDAAMVRRWRSVLVGHALLSREGVTTSAVPAPLDIACLEDQGRHEPLSVTAYFVDRSRPNGRSRTLDAVVEDDGVLGAGAVERLMVCLAAALNAFGHGVVAARGETLVHGDIKPANILVDSATWTYGLIDCVEGRRVELLGASPDDDRPFFTASWAPPEACGGHEPGDSGIAGSATGRTSAWDVWSTAVTTVWAARKLDPTEVRERILANEDSRWDLAAAVTDTGVAPALGAVLAEALVPDPDRRLPARDFVERVRDWQCSLQ